MEKCRRFVTIIDFSWIKVSYQADLFLDINKDYVVAEHQTLLNVSNCSFMTSLFPSLPHDSSKSSKFSSIGSRFKLQLQSLMETLSATKPHYIRCVKPNNVLKPTIFENINVIQKLRCGALIEKTNINPSQVGDIIVGTLIAEGSQRATECRMVAFYAAFPEVVPVKTLNRQGALGLQAVVDIAATIKAGFYDIGIGAGVESMSTNPMPTTWEGSLNPKVQDLEKALALFLAMGITSENIAARFGITRAEQIMLHSSAKVSHEPKDKKEKPQGLVTRSTSASKGSIQSKVSILYCTNWEETSIHG